MKYIFLESYDNYVSAHIALGQLKENEIDCYLENENTVTIDPIVANSIGGIRLMVMENQLAKAREILNIPAR